MARKLPSEIDEIVRIITDVAESREKERLKGVTAREAERVGLGSPQLFRAREEVRGRTDEAIALQVAELLERTRGEKRQERLIGEERLFSEKMTRAQWAETLKRMREGQAFGALEAEKRRGFAREERIAGQEFLKEQSEEARKRASKSAWTKLITNVLLGAATGGIAPGLVGAAGTFGGAGMGALLGGQTVGGLAGRQLGGGGQFDEYLNFLIQSGLKKSKGGITAGVTG